MPSIIKLLKCIRKIESDENVFLKADKALNKQNFLFYLKSKTNFVTFRKCNPNSQYFKIDLSFSIKLQNTNNTITYIFYYKVLCFFKRNIFILVYRFIKKITDVRFFVKMSARLKEFDQHLTRNYRKEGTRTRNDKMRRDKTRRRIMRREDTETAGMSHSRLVSRYSSFSGIINFSLL